MASVAGAGASLLDKLDRLVGSTVLHEARVYPVPTVPPGGVSHPATAGFGEVSGVGTSTSLTTPPTALTTVVQTNDFVVLPGPEDVLLLNTTTGLYQQSVTLTARMYPIEATAAKSIWGLPTLIWGILIGTVVILILILATLFFCCWLQPRTRKLLNSSYYTTAANNGNASQSSIVAKSCTSSDSNQLVMPLSIGICPPQYSAPPPPNASQQPSHPSPMINDESEGETGTSYRTRSLPSWGKNKQRPLSNADDLEELYAKVNFSKKRRNRMRNDEAAIIALCRSRSQNLSALPLAATEQDAVVVYDERTAL
ncbi:AGAP013535-PA-like protein [Anopheles sinensis]|uniref:AGAP013535-PA-like protein n=1 Tax=Anopheles sinensis TaxID=74873 RepID=A0A084VW19_ANOSI|nr:AGAP013535-PA-like protein [Anopheles sinensis]